MEHPVVLALLGTSFTFLANGCRSGNGLFCEKRGVYQHA